MKSKAIIRKGTKNDLAALLSLIKELAVFENEPNAVELTEADLLRDGFGEVPLFFFYVAEVEAKIVGLALCFYKYSTWKGKTIHLEDLIVAKEHRNNGIGKQLLNQIIEVAQTEKVQRLEWNVLDWNTNAIDFYKKTGAEILNEWLLVRLNKKQINNYIIK